MQSKFLSSLLLASSLIMAMPVDAGSIGRSSSSGSFSSSRSSSSSSSYSRPSAPAQAAPAPSKPGGIGGTTASVGVRKPDVTQPVTNKVEAAKAPPAAPAAGYAGGGYNSAYSHSAPPTYGSVPVQPVVVHQSSGFGGAFTGSLMGSMIGNSLFNHNGGTTVVNNGGGYSQPSAQGGGVYVAGQTTVPSGPVTEVNQKEDYGMWHFMWDLITFVILAALLVGVAWVFYKGYKMVKEYVDRERGVDNGQPFSPTKQFWEIQKAFADADIDSLNRLLGPDVVFEMTMNLSPTTISLHNVSHEVRLNTPREFSVWYTFEDGGATINQVWHYEKFASTWKLNGIENV